MSKKILTQSRLKEVLNYCPETGVFTRKVRTSNNTKTGDVAGCKKPSGYLAIGVDGVVYAAHRLAFLFSYGRFPHGALDHINRDRSDNRIVNLRECTIGENNKNIGSKVGSSSRYLGVSRYKPTGKWQASISVCGKSRNLGYFTKEIDAAKAYDFHAKEHHKEFANLNFPD